MGRRGSQIIPFLMAALASNRYVNLKFENVAEFVFSLSLPRKTKKLNAESEQILKDWRAFKKQPYNYTKAKQAIESALKKSVFLEQIPSNENKLIYRKLNEREINEKKSLLKPMAVKKEYIDPPSVDSSGYGSGDDSPSTSNETVKEDLAMKHVIEHDHMLYSLSSLHNRHECDYTLGLKEEAIPFSQSDILHESSFVNPNNILIDYRNTQSPDLYSQTFESDTMEVDDKENVSYLNEQYNNPVETETDDSVVNALFNCSVGPYDFKDASGNIQLPDLYGQTYESEFIAVDNKEQVLSPNEQNEYPVKIETDVSALFNYFLGPYDLQDAFADITFENTFDSHELDELIRSTGDSMLLSSGNNLGVLNKSLKKVYRFKESKSLDDGEVWIFYPEVKELSPFYQNEGDPSSSKMILDDEKFKRMQSCFLEHDLSNGQIFIYLKHKHLVNL